MSNRTFFDFLFNYQITHGNLKGSVDALMKAFNVDRLTAKFAVQDYFDLLDS